MTSFYQTQLKKLSTGIKELKLQTDELERERERRAAGMHVDEIERQLDGSVLSAC